jgi:serine protease Do
VVSIGSTREARDPSGEEEGDPMDWGEESIGSGFIIDPRGYILTNYHLVGSAKHIQVRLHDDREVRARVVQVDPQSDIALIKIEEEGLAALPMGESETARVGQWVLAVGSPFGLTQTVSAGIVSALHRSDLKILPFESFIQTDASINPGNSGGPLVNLRGEAIGISTAMYSNPGGGNQGIGFAVPIDLAKALVRRWIEGKSASFIGLVPARVDPDMARYFGLEEPRGAFVARIDAGSPAEKGGLRAKDLILSFGFKPVRDEGHLRVLVAGSPPNEPIDVEVLRGSSRETVRLVPAERAEGEPSPAAPAGVPDEPKTRLLGITVTPVTPELAERLDLPPARDGMAVLDVQQGSAAAKKGLRRGDLILEINERPVAGLEDVRLALEAARGAVMLGVFRGPSEVEYIFVPR